MTIDAARFQKLLNDFKLEQLFNEFGWDHASLKPQEIPVSGEVFTLTAIAQKRGVAVLRCTPDGAGNIPPRPTLLKIEKEATKLAHEHLLVFADAAQTMLTWLWVARVPGQPNATRTHTWHKGTSGESLRQKLNQIVWALEEEEAITLTDVITGLRKAFDRDRVSKKFYEHFKAEHQAFADFIEGIAATTDQAWYASLMLNRLMFVYFIQQKGFLDGNQNYLADRMRRVREQAGEGHFHTFYRQFLRRLFHEGLGQHKGSRGADLSTLIGEVPYLNGGLFAVHELEEAHPDIDIPDEAFERLFAFFDAYDWHLDDRPLSKGSEINPDVLGYIFEKYINQKQMGAYYTKEDITEYISKNTVVPHLLEQARERCKVAFDGETSVWNLLKADPDRYLYPAMKTGVVDASGNVVPETVLPDFVQTGMHDPKARMFERRYNLSEAVFHTATGERGTLPTETWREYVERRTRCLAVRDKLASGEVKSADDLITFNLDIRQFMQDVIDTCTGPDLLRAVWQAIVGRVPEKANEKFRHGITILDPTCGSGAFLFAALNVLEPLYEACLDRMEGFVEDAARHPSPASGRGAGGEGKPGEGAFADFTKILAEVAHHPSRRYFIYKSIILHNLFGVDIMAEAVEICKLRLFLKLVSQVDGGRELEPLPDIDFNIRAGNTLVGYATEAQFDAANTLASDQTHRAEIKASTADLADAFDFFRQQQTVHGGKVTTDDKRKLRDKLSGLSLELDRYLAHDYGINPDKKNEFAAWRESHQPFHWFAEFYGVMREGGFDVVIGNPPYVEYSKIRSTYSIHGFKTEDSGNLYAYTIERSGVLVAQDGNVGLIVPIAAISVSETGSVRETIRTSYQVTWFSSYAIRPAKLFEGVEQRLTIFVAHKGGEKRGQILSTKYHQWYVDERPHLFQALAYCPLPYPCNDSPVAKCGSPIARSALEKLEKASGNKVGTWLMGRGFSPLFFHRTPGYWIRMMDFEPYFRSPTATRSVHHIRELSAVGRQEASFIGCIVSSSLYFYRFFSLGNCRNLTLDDVHQFPLGKPSVSSLHRADELFSRLMSDYQKNAVISRRGKTEFQEFNWGLSKHIVDEIDTLLAEHYGMNEVELDFIVNYDLKIRMGAGADDEE
ncbi:MAG: Eco57I restriction-modification methylase domain-containing protein [Sulfurimicrobium sp.]|nr:Eco57I restriction-modification methylase domain-containing protein [Sulfurimicrobium sp.]